MIKIRYILFVIFLSLQSCKSQNIKIVVNDNNFSVNDSLQISAKNKSKFKLEKINKNEYILSLISFKDELVVIYKNKSFTLVDLNEQVKNVYFEFNNDANDECYIIHRVFGDAIQSNQTSLLNDCGGITNIYYSNSINYNPSGSIKVRRKEN